jgi:hypothetical protein
MARQVQRHWDEEDVLSVVELDEGWVTRHLELPGPERATSDAARLLNNLPRASCLDPLR